MTLTKVNEDGVPRYDFSSPRLFVDHPLAPGALVPLGRDQAHYLGTVLRLRQGSAVLAFNGRDGEWRTTFTPSGRASASLTLDAQTRPQTPPGGVEYLFAPLKHARLDYLVQKAVEMGAAALLPVLTRRTQPTRLNLERMRANAIEAAEQCGILALPRICEPVRLVELLAGWPASRLLIFCDEDAPVADPLAALSAPPPHREVAVLIGPEGGFDDDERRALVALPCRIRLSLGPRILRADTAGVAALALVQAVLGDWRAGAADDPQSLFEVGDQKMGMPPATVTSAPDV